MLENMDTRGKQAKEYTVMGELCAYRCGFVFGWEEGFAGGARECCNPTLKTKRRQWSMEVSNSPVYMTQRMQVEDEWELRLRSGWGPH